VEDAKREIQFLFRPKKDAIRGFALKGILRELMWDKVGVIKNMPMLEEGIERFQEMRESLLPRLGVDVSHKKYNHDIVEALEARAMVKLGLLMAQSATMRKESRGAHALEGYPQQDDQQYLKNVVARRKANGDGEFMLVPVPGAS